MTTHDGNRFDVELDTPAGPRIRVWGDASPGEILDELPAGWTIHDDDWGNSVQTDSGAMSYPLTRKTP